MRYGVLGPLLATDGSGQWLRLRGDRQRSLLAMLLFHANTRVPAERLVNALWPDLPPKSYASNLHTYVSRLRERLGPIEHVGDGYRFAVDVADLDLLVFRAEADRGRRAKQAGDPAAAAVHLRTALAQWRGHPLDDVHLPALDAEVTRLEDERLSVLEDCLDAELAAGRDAELIGELRVAVAEYPLRERLTGLLMTAMQRSGRQADAIEVYRHARATLVAETGLEPGAGLRAVHAAVLRGDDTEPTPAPWPVRQLPADSDGFTGREETVAELTELLTDRRAPVVVLTGEPGAGKSTLALRVAHRVLAAFPDGQLYAHLAGATEPRAVDDVLADLLRSLGVVGQGIPDDTQAKAAVLRSRLADRQVLIVLDDAADPGQIRPLIPGTPTSAVLVTSRRRLTGLGGAHRVTVGSLSDGEARELLVRLAGDRAEPEGAARIAAACGNLPLALRIAGTRLALRPGLTPSALADRLEDERRRLDELTVSDLRVRSSLALSYRALSAPAAALFRELGMVGIGSLPAWALTVLADGPAGERAVDELIESSLLQPTGADRYALHDLVRAYARELARADDTDLAAAGTRLLDAVIGLSDRFARQLPRALPMPDLTEHLPVDLDVPVDAETWFAAERPGLVAAVLRMCAAGRYTGADRLFDRLARFLWPHGFHDDLRTCATALAGGPDERIRVRAEAVLAVVLHVRGEYRLAEAKYRWCAERVDRATHGWVLANLAHCLTGLGEPDEALTLAAEAEHLLAGDGFGLLSVARVRSAALNRLGRPGESVGIDTAALDDARRAGEPRRVAQALQNLSWSLALTGRLDDAAAAATEAVSLLQGPSARSARARSLRTLGAIHAGRGERTLALQAFAEGRELAEELNERPRVLACVRAIAAGWVGAGRAADAVPELRACLAAYREMGSLSSATVTLRLLASAYTATGDHTAAADATAEADRLADPRDANADTLVRLLLTLTHAPGGPLNRPAPGQRSDLA